MKGDITNIESFDGKFYILGAGKVEIHNTDSKLPPFKSAPVAGGGGGGSSSSVSGFQIEKYIDERIIGATSVSTLPYELTYGSAVVLNNEIHIFGAGGDEPLHYKFNGTSWERVSTLPYGLSDVRAVGLSNEIHILGGGEDGAPHYKFNGTSWESEYILPYEFNGGSAVVLNNEIHILGGRPAPTNHYTVTPDTRHISALIPKGVHILLPDIQKIIYASDNVAIEENNVACVTGTGYVEIIAKLTEFNEAYNGGLVFYW